MSEASFPLSSLTNIVEAVYGQSASKVLACDKQIVCETINHGFRTLTHDSTEKGVRRPYRWMCLRKVQWSEIEKAIRWKKRPGGGGAGLFEEHVDNVISNEPLWHVVIQELRGRHSREAVVPSAYFLTRFHVVFDAIRGKLDLLDVPGDDDPAIIQAAASDEVLVGLLRCYYESGDKTDQQRYLNVANITRVFEGAPLISFCCERGLRNCVQLLLDRFTPSTAPFDKPWFWWADPLLAEPSYGNNAFSIAVYRSDADLLQRLFSWAERPDVNALERVHQTKDHKGRNLCQLAHERLVKKRMFAASADVQQAIAVFNMVAPAFGMEPEPLPIESAHTIRPTNVEEDRSWLTVSVRCDADRNDGEAPTQPTWNNILHVPLPPTLTLSELSDIVVAECSNVTMANNHSVSIFGASISGGNLDTAIGENVSVLQRMLNTLRDYARISTVKCSATSDVSIAWAAAIAECIPAGVAWRSIQFPTFLASAIREDETSGISDRGLFADAMEKLVSALKDGWADKCFNLLSVEGDNGFFCIPEERRQILGRLAETFRMKKVLVDRMSAAVSDTTSHWSTRPRDDGNRAGSNPFFFSIATIERKLLSKSVLTTDVASTIEDALDKSWPDHVYCAVSTWLWQVACLPTWQQRSGVSQEVITDVVDLVDRATIMFLRLRPKAERFGLDVVTIVAQAAKGYDLEKMIPKTAAYSRKCDLGLVTNSLPNGTGGSLSEFETDHADSCVVAGGEKGKAKGKEKGKEKGTGKGKAKGQVESKGFGRANWESNSRFDSCYRPSS